MSKYDFSRIDFSKPEIIESLARAYAVLSELESRDEQQEEYQDRGKQKQVLPKKQHSKKKQRSAYVQLRLF